MSFLINVPNFRVVEGNSSSQTISVPITLSSVATAEVTFSYFLQSATATRDDFIINSGLGAIPFGSQSVNININIRGDTFIEGNEEFQLVVIAGQNGVLNGAAALSTITIQDNDDTIPDLPAGAFGTAANFSGPASASLSLPTLSVHSVAATEENSFSEYMNFLVVLDRVATAPVTFNYHTIDGTAGAAVGDYDAGSGSVTIPAGMRAEYIRVPVRGNTVIEQNESFQLVLTNVSNAVFANNASALVASGLITDDDGGSRTPGAGIGGLAETIAGPASASALRSTLTIKDASIIEGDNFSQYLRFLVTLDRPLTAAASFDLVVTDLLASNASGDFDGFSTTVNLPAGTESTYFEVPVLGDVAIEGTQTFQAIASGIRGGALFANNAPALVAVGSILDNDTGVYPQFAGIGGDARPVQAPASLNGLTTARVYASSAAEGDSFSEYAYVYVVLSQPPTVPVTMNVSTAPGTAVRPGDYDVVSSQLTIPAGVQSGWVSFFIKGDTAIEGDESFTVNFSGITGATFENGLTSISTTLTIRDNDGGGTAEQLPSGPAFLFGSIPSQGPDLLFGTAGDDSIDGLGGADTIRGEQGNDRLNGGTGSDTLDGGDNNDWLEGGAGADILIGGSGQDFAVYHSSNTGVYIDLLFSNSYNGDAAGDTFQSIEGASMSNFDDGVWGTDGDNSIFGLLGADYIDGRGGADVILGGHGVDTLVGGAGADYLAGEAGADVFRYTALTDSLAAAPDYIADFSTAQGDKIDVSALSGGGATFNAGWGVGTSVYTFSQGGGTWTLVQFYQGSSLHLQMVVNAANMSAIDFIL